MVPLTQSLRVIERDSKFELLRLVLMYLIVFHHGIVHGLNLVELRFPDCLIHENVFFSTCLINSFCIVAVNTFILISGFFSIKTTKNKLIRLVCLVFVCTLLFNTLYFLIQGNVRRVFSSLLIISHSRYWFIVDYLVLMVLAPAINLFFDNFTQNKQGLFVVALLFITCYLGFFWQFEANVNGYTVFQFITMYSIGRYLHNNRIHINEFPAVFIYLLCSISIALLMLFLHKSGNDSYAWALTHYNNPVLIISAIAFFFIFKNIKIQNQRINRLSTSSLFIYLFTSSALVESIYYPFVRSAYIAHEGIIFPIIAASALLLYLIAVLIDQLLISRIVDLLHNRLMSINLSKVSLS